MQPCDINTKSQLVPQAGDPLKQLKNQKVLEYCSTCGKSGRVLDWLGDCEECSREWNLGFENQE